MLLIAESGSTKTDWCLAMDYQQQLLYETAGFNPYFYGGDVIAQRLRAELPSELQQQKPDAIHFYGAGASSESLKGRVVHGLQQVFPQSQLEVEHDLLGSARALCGSRPGIATILGTGSNACEFDGRDISAQSGGIGYILGDEGSGTDLGRRWLQHFFYGELPDDLHQAFQTEVGPDKATIIDQVYRQPDANRYLASYAEFLGRHQQHPFVRELVKTAFATFLKRHVLRFGYALQYPVHSVGSIAYYFYDIWQDALAEHQLEAGRVITRPIENLVTYHLSGGVLPES